MEEKDIKSKIKKVILRCSDSEIYSNIIKDFFTIGIDKKGHALDSLKILPELKEIELQKKFKENKQKICDFIKNQNINSSSLVNIVSLNAENSFLFKST